jgi:hypothetical protein
MIKSIVVHDIPINHIAAMERWYFREHTAEIVRRYGPWLTRHESFLPVFPPPEAQAYGFYNWRVTEGWWREIPETGPRGTFSFTVPPVWPKVATCFIPAQPTEDFMGFELQAREKNVLRWYVLLKYPDDVASEEGEDWFLNVHAREVMKQPGLYRFFSYKVIKEPISLPGVWAPGKTPPPDSVLHDWDRVCELWYETFDDWRKSVIEAPPHYTRPSWAKYEKYPFLEPYIDFVCSFILERPNDEFLRDSRGYL